MLCILFDLLSCLHRPAAVEVADAHAACAGVASLEYPFICFTCRPSAFEDKGQLHAFLFYLTPDAEADHGEGVMKEDRVIVTVVDAGVS